MTYSDTSLANTCGVPLVMQILPRAMHLCCPCRSPDPMWQATNTAVSHHILSVHPVFTILWEKFCDMYPALYDGHDHSIHTGPTVEFLVEPIGLVSCASA